jgi:riboflavin kinase/FMN adenylyltransferase
MIPNTTLRLMTDTDPRRDTNGDSSYHLRWGAKTGERDPAHCLTFDHRRRHGRAARHDHHAVMTDTKPKPFVVLRDEGPFDALRGGVFALGNFDGVHRGHRAVIAAARERAASLGVPAAVLTFEPHPRAFFRPEEPLFRLTDERNKLRLLAASGLDGALVMRFDAALARLTAQEFVDRILVERLAVSGVVVGYNFHFGKARAGSPEFLAAEGQRRGIVVDIAPQFTYRGRPVSSGPVREALIAVDVADAAELLGFPWFVSGTVIHGEKRGRALGYPTANLALDPACRLRHGIYAVRVGIGGERHDGVASFGRRPTFDNGAVLLEVFLFDYAGDLYGRDIDVAFIGWVREEMKFASVEALIARMDEDSRTARALLAQEPTSFLPEDLKPI